MGCMWGEWRVAGGGMTRSLSQQQLQSQRDREHEQQTERRLEEAVAEFARRLDTLSRDKKNVDALRLDALQATRTHGAEVAGRLLQKLNDKIDREASSHKRLTLFYLVDAIVQHSSKERAAARDAFAASTEYFLSKMVSATVHGGAENRKAILKVSASETEACVLCVCLSRGFRCGCLRPPRLTPGSSAAVNGQLVSRRTLREGRGGRYKGEAGWEMREMSPASRLLPSEAAYPD